ncbi:MAG: c-type cytochrome [Rubrivivax sp.]
MSQTPQDDQAHDDAHEVHEGPIKTPKQLIWTVVASFVVPVIIIIGLTNFVASDPKQAPGSDGLGAEATARRIQPVGTIELRDASAPAVLRTGEQVYQGQCMACHGSGAAGAPKFGDAAAWAPRIGTGLDALLNSALKGKGAMAAQGGGEYSDFEISRAIVYMANQAGGRLAEPKAPEAAASAASAAK